eukprot:366327-Chlamydomonas_euryale.AAC.10
MPLWTLVSDQSLCCFELSSVSLYALVTTLAGSAALNMPVLGCCFSMPVLGCCFSMPVLGCCISMPVLGCCSNMPVLGCCFSMPVLGCCLSMPVLGCWTSAGSDRGGASAQGRRVPDQD